MKEKRILCIEVSGECKNFADIDTPLLADAFKCQQGLYCCKNTAWKPITKDACKNCKEGRYQGLTRKQAIEKMAKAAKKAYRGYFYIEPHHPNISDIMEAALNALLEEQK